MLETGELEMYHTNVTVTVLLLPIEEWRKDGNAMVNNHTPPKKQRKDKGEEKAPKG